MILERLSEGARKELEALSKEERQQLAEDLRQASDIDQETLAFLDRMQDRPLFDRSVDIVALIREGRRM